MGVQLTVGRTMQLTASMNHAPDGAAAWSSLNPAAATVTPGPSATATVTGVAVGSTVITATDGACSVSAGVDVVAGPTLACAGMGIGVTG